MASSTTNQQQQQKINKYMASSRTNQQQQQQKINKYMASSRTTKESRFITLKVHSTHKGNNDRDLQCPQGTHDTYTRYNLHKNYLSHIFRMLNKERKKINLKQE